MTSVPSADADFCLLAAHSLAERLDALAEQLPAARQGDAEGIHKTRIASRRLRCGLDVFEGCLPKQTHAEWTRAVRRITRRLRETRDLDVQIVSVETFREDLREKHQRPGIDRLLLRLRQRRQKRQARVVKELRRLEKRKVIEEIQQGLHQLRVRANLREARTDSPANAQAGGDLICLRLAELLGFQPYVEQADHAAELHRMRIAVKRLRYTMEIFSPVFGGSLKPFIAVCKNIQTLLGDLHDCAVWLDFLPRFEEKELARTLRHFGHARGFKRLAAGWREFAEDRRRAGSTVHEEFVATWRALERDNRWQALRQAVDGRATAPQPAAAPSPEPAGEAALV